MKKIACTIILTLTALIGHANNKQPKLIVQIVIDQLRGDLIQQHQQQFTADGFNYLLTHGLNYHNAHHPHANTTTCAGHATISTGSYPSMHGIVDNDWYDRKTNKLIYCMEDLSNTPIPTAHTKVLTPGRSPRNLAASTFSDEVVLARKGKAFAVSLKDRSAIALAGHAGQAFWFDKSNGDFITSSYYASQYPRWVQEWNKNYQALPFTWSLSQPKASYQNANTPVVSQQESNFGQTFPHRISNPPSEEYFKFLSKTPKADQLTNDFAEHLIVAEQLGQSSQKTDYLAISFSAVDGIGHQFGPNSLEAEDNLLMLDQTLSHLLKTIDQHVGLNNTLIVLTADHGVNNSPSYLKAHHITTIKPLDVPKTGQKVQTMLEKRYHLPKETLLSITPPYLYLNHKIISKHHLSVQQVSQSVAQLLSQKSGVFKAYALPITQGKSDWLSAKIERMSYPYRAGDVYLVPMPNQFNGAHSEYPITHGSPWQYDSYVPLLFVSANFKAQSITRMVYTTDIAPTLSALLRIKPPSAAVGEPLSEVLNQYQ